jgi:hypothetical protein
MQFHSGCEYLFPTDSDTGLLVVPTGMDVLEPSGNGLYLLPSNYSHPQAPRKIPRTTTVPVLPSLPSAIPCCGTAGLDTLICKAYMPITPTVSQLARY